MMLQCNFRFTDSTKASNKRRCQMVHLSAWQLKENAPCMHAWNTKKVARVRHGLKVIHVIREVGIDICICIIIVGQRQSVNKDDTMPRL
jgi:hypothetical protein